MKEILPFIHNFTYLGWIESTVSMSAVGPYLVANREKNTRMPARMDNKKLLVCQVCAGNQRTVTIHFLAPLNITNLTTGQDMKNPNSFQVFGVAF